MKPCGIESEVDGENNKVRNEQKIDIITLNLASNEGDSCDVWSSYGLRRMILTFLMITIIGAQDLIQQRWMDQKLYRKER